MLAVSKKAVEVFRRQVAVGWSAETANDEKDHEIRSTGQCAATAVVFQQVFGGVMVSTMVEGVSHWYNQVGEYDIDLTGDQFGHAPIRMVPKGSLYNDARERTHEEVDGATALRAMLLALKATEIAMREIREKGLLKK